MEPETIGTLADDLGSGAQLNMRGITLGAADEQIGQYVGAGINSYRGSDVKVLAGLAAYPMALGGQYGMIPTYTCDVQAVLFRVPGKGGWVFAPVPGEFAPNVAVGWGRTPVLATVDGRTWKTSVWREKSGQTVLAVPQKVRGGKDHEDTVAIRLEYSIEYR